MFLIPDARGRGLGPDAARAMAEAPLHHGERGRTRVTVDPYAWNERRGSRVGARRLRRGPPATTPSRRAHRRPWIPPWISFVARLAAMRSERIADTPWLVGLRVVLSVRVFRVRHRRLLQLLVPVVLAGVHILGRFIHESRPSRQLGARTSRRRDRARRRGAIGPRLAEQAVLVRVERRVQDVRLRSPTARISSSPPGTRRTPMRSTCSATRPRTCWPKP